MGEIDKSHKEGCSESELPAARTVSNLRILDTGETLNLNSDRWSFTLKCKTLKIQVTLNSALYFFTFSQSKTLKVTLSDCISLPPANKVCEGYVFTGVCLSTRGSLSSGVTVQRGLFLWGLHPGGSLSRGSLLEGLCQGDPPSVRLRAGGTHPTGMHSCYKCHSLGIYLYVSSPSVYLLTSRWESRIV